MATTEKRSIRKTYTPPENAREAMLPGATLLGLVARNWLELENALQRGLPPRVIKILKDEAGVTAGEIAPLLGLSPATLHRRASQKSHKRLDPDESARAYRIARVLARATEVLGKRESARSWLREPLLAIGNRTPLEAIRTESGAELVLHILGRLEDGVYS
jgi:putative toxin-antitoxin system antitoxin component (TIGR02293 family)